MKVVPENVKDKYSTASAGTLKMAIKHQEVSF